MSIDRAEIESILSTQLNIRIKTVADLAACWILQKDNYTREDTIRLSDLSEELERGIYELIEEAR